MEKTFLELIEEYCQNTLSIGHASNYIDSLKEELSRFNGRSTMDRDIHTHLHTQPLQLADRIIEAYEIKQEAYDAIEGLELDLKERMRLLNNTPILHSTEFNGDMIVVKLNLNDDEIVATYP